MWCALCFVLALLSFSHMSTYESVHTKGAICVPLLWYPFTSQCDFSCSCSILRESSALSAPSKVSFLAFLSLLLLFSFLSYFFSLISLPLSFFSLSLLPRLPVHKSFSVFEGLLPADTVRTHYERYIEEHHLASMVSPPFCWPDVVGVWCVVLNVWVKDANGLSR